MELRQCGTSELHLSALGMGCWPFGGGHYWGDQNQADVNAVVAKALDLGINYFDTAEAYNDGRSEESLGLALKTIDRSRAIVGTKVAPSNCDPERLVAACENSLRRLGTDYIDLYMVHWPMTPISIRHFCEEPRTPSPAKAFETMMKLRDQGKIRYVGVSNFGRARMQEACDHAEIVVNELPYSLLTRGIEWEVLPFCRENGVGVIGYMALLQGVLADIFPTLEDVPVWQRRTRHFSAAKTPEARHGSPGCEAETNQALEAIRRIARDAGMSMPEIAVKWALAGEGLSCILVGSRNTDELEANVASAAEPLDPAVVEALNRDTDEVKEKLGRSFDYYESLEHDRTL